MYSNIRRLYFSARLLFISSPLLLLFYGVSVHGQSTVVGYIIDDAAPAKELGVELYRLMVSDIRNMQIPVKMEENLRQEHYDRDKYFEEIINQIQALSKQVTLVSERLNEVEEGIRARVTAFEERLTDQIENITNALKEVDQNVEARLNAIISERLKVVEERIHSQVTVFEEHLNEQSRNITNALSIHDKNMETRSDHFDSLGETIDDQLQMHDIRLTEFEEHLKEHIENITSSLKEMDQNVAVRLNIHDENMNRSTLNRHLEFKGMLDALGKNLQDHDKRLRIDNLNMSTHLMRNYRSLQEQEKSIGKLGGNLTTAEERLTNRITIIDENTRTKYSDIKNRLDSLDRNLQNHDQRLRMSKSDVSTLISRNEGKLTTIDSLIQQQKTYIINLENRFEMTICPPGFDYISASHSCYKFVSERLNWEDASKKCQNMYSGAYAAVISSTTDQMAVASYINSKLTYFQSGICGTEGVQTVWTSGQRLKLSCSWDFVWEPRPSTTINMAYTNWVYGEPNCDGEEYCMGMRIDRYYQWNDSPCSFETCVLCEVDTLSFQTRM